MGAYNRNRKSALQQAIVVQIKISIALTDLLIKLQNITINRFNFRREGVWEATIRCIKTESTRKLGDNILIFSGQKPLTRIIKSILHAFFAFFKG